MSGNYMLSDRSLVALALNCVNLREIMAKNCALITPEGIHFALSHIVNLNKISVNSISLNPRCALEISFPCSRALHTLKLADSLISDELLRSVAKACVPLRALSLSGCTDFTISGLSLLLRSYQSLEFLALERLGILTNQSMIKLCQFLPNLVAIQLNYCSNLSDPTFFALAKNCPLLKRIEMGNTSLGRDNCTEDLAKNFAIKLLNLEFNLMLGDKSLKRIASVCPSLEMLNVRSCSGITDGGLAEVLKSCCEIRHLCIDECWEIKSIPSGFDLGKLEILQVASAGISNEGIAMIGKICPGLVKFDMEGCFRVSTEAVKEMVRNCKRLREINLRFCYEIDGNIVDWMVFSRPSSLRKIIAPRHFSTTQSQKMLFLRHGCLVCE